MSRLVSGFKNKFVKDHGQFYKSYKDKILQFTQRESQVKRQQRTNITFTEFLSYMVSTKNVLRYDEHFDNYNKLCSPCAIQYNFIGKQETFDQDTKYLLTNIFRSGIKTPPSPLTTKSGRLETYTAFKQVPKNVTAIAIRQYSSDTEMFGYDIKGYI